MTPASTSHFIPKATFDLPPDHRRGHSRFMARTPKRLPTVPPPRELEALVKATSNQRDRLILMSMYYLGLRVSESCKLAVPDMDFERRLLLVRDGKGGKDRAVPLPDWLVGPLRGWVGNRREGPVFVSRKGGHLCTRAVQILIKRLALAAKLPDAEKHRKYRPHALRHGFALDFWKRTKDIRALQMLLGHENLNTTMRYMQLDPEHLREMMNTR